MAASKSKTVRVPREWLGEAIPTAIEMAVKGIAQPAWYADTFGLTPEAGLRNIIEALRRQAKE